MSNSDAVNQVNALGAQWASDFDDYATGEVSSPTCVLCQHSPCNCPPFGTPRVRRRSRGGR